MLRMTFFLSGVMLKVDERLKATHFIKTLLFNFIKTENCCVSTKNKREFEIKFLSRKRLSKIFQYSIKLKIIFPNSPRVFILVFHWPEGYCLSNFPPHWQKNLLSFLELLWASSRCKSCQNISRNYLWHSDRKVFWYVEFSWRKCRRHSASSPARGDLRLTWDIKIIFSEVMQPHETWPLQVLVQMRLTYRGYPHLLSHCPRWPGLPPRVPERQPPRHGSQGDSADELRDVDRVQGMSSSNTLRLRWRWHGHLPGLHWLGDLLVQVPGLGEGYTRGLVCRAEKNILELEKYLIEIIFSHLTLSLLGDEELRPNTEPRLPLLLMPRATPFQFRERVEEDFWSIKMNRNN